MISLHAYLEDLVDRYFAARARRQIRRDRAWLRRNIVKDDPAPGCIVPNIREPNSHKH